MSDDSGRAANQDSPAGPTGIPCASSLAMFSAPTAAAIPMTTLALAVANASVRRNVPGAGPPVHARAPEISAITKTTETAAYVSVINDLTDKNKVFKGTIDGRDREIKDLKDEIKKLKVDPKGPIEKHAEALGAALKKVSGEKAIEVVEGLCAKLHINPRKQLNPPDSKAA